MVGIIDAIDLSSAATSDLADALSQTASHLQTLPDNRKNIGKTMLDGLRKSLGPKPTRRWAWPQDPRSAVSSLTRGCHFLTIVKKRPPLRANNFALEPEIRPKLSL